MYIQTFGPCRSDNGRKGFTLVEILVTAALVGLGIAAILGAVRAGTQANAAAAELNAAVFLAQEIREWTMTLPFRDPDPADHNNPPGPDGTSPQIYVDDVDDLMDVTYSPPRNSMGQAMTEMSDWSEVITLTWRELDDLASVVTPGTSDVINVQVVVRRGSRDVLTSNWLVVHKE